MSQTNIDLLLNIWSATLAPHNDEPPITGVRDLHAQIDAIDLGFTPWKSSTVQYQGRRPENSATPQWMDEKFQLWYRDPRKVIHDILGNPDFSAALDYIPYRDLRDGKRSYCDFMSGDWSWNQCVRPSQGGVQISPTYLFLRISLQRTQKPMVVRLSRLCSALTKQLFRSQPDNMNTTQFTYRSGMFAITFEGRTRTRSS